MKEITDAFGYWFSGFTDGEACFSIHKQNYDKPRSNYLCRFRISLRDDDTPVLEKIRDTLGLGTISNTSTHLNGDYLSQSQAAFGVAAINDCAELVDLFEKYPLQAKKKNDFEIWKAAVKELQKSSDCRDAELLEYYFQKIKQVRRYEEQEELPKPKIASMQLTINFT